MAQQPYLQTVSPIVNHEDIILEFRDVQCHFPVKRQFLDRLTGQPELSVHAVDNISFQVGRGETFGLVGESGCGKTTTGRLALGLLAPTAGKIYFAGQPLNAADASAIRPLRPQMQMIFQDPVASLNPRMVLGESIGHGLKIHKLVASEAEYRERVIATMERVGLRPGAAYFDRYAHALSGGEQQRAVIARAIIMQPHLIVADEPVAMADVSVRAVLLDLLKELQQEFDLTYLFITHDLATARYVCDRVAIMYLGEIVEIGEARSVLRHPKHPYTEALLAALPVPDPRIRRTVAIPRGEVPSAINPPPGCRFHPRCPLVQDICRVEAPTLRLVPEQPGHLAACHLRTGDYIHLDPTPAVQQIP
jgi:peptide/nickel transport system ATP-binding protein